MEFKGVFAEGCGEVIDFEGAEQCYRGISEHRHGLGGLTFADATGVLAEHHVADPEALVLDPPAATPQLEQPARIGLLP